MSGVKIVAVLLIVAGVAGLIAGGFTYTEETHDAKLGPIELEVKDKERVDIPVWASVGVIVVGAGLLLFAGKRR